MSTRFDQDFDPEELFSELEQLYPDQVPALSPAQKQFDLYLQLRQIKQVSAVLKELKRQPLLEQRTWLKENEPLIADLADAFADSSLSRLQGMATDQETVQLSVDLVVSLRQTLLQLDDLLVATKSTTRRAS